MKKQKKVSVSADDEKLLFYECEATRWRSMIRNSIFDDDDVFIFGPELILGARD